MINARALLLADGSSDEPLGRHVATLARSHGVELDVVNPEFDRMSPSPGRTVRGRLELMLRVDADFDVLLVHRDCEGHAREMREAEILAGAGECEIQWPVIPIVPIRMTEAWLLLDEAAIRMIAGRPSGTEPLDLPRASQVETMSNPKVRLQGALETACGLSGRRLKKFKRDFPAHRRQLLERLDRSGPVKELSAWQALEAATGDAMISLRDSR